MDLTGKIAVVTGAGRGIGRAIAIGFAAAGARVCCNARTESQITSTVDHIVRQGGEAFAVTGDVTDLKAMDNLFAMAKARYGGVDIVVANAGIEARTESIEASDPDAWKSVVATNLFGAYHTARAAIPLLRASPAGKLIFVGSGAGHRAVPGISAYCSSKAALWMLVRSLAQELGPFGIDVNELLPGPVNTDLLRANPGPAIEQIRQIEWVKEADDVVPLALFLASQPARGPSAQSFSLMRREC